VAGAKIWRAGIALIYAYCYCLCLSVRGDLQAREESRKADGGSLSVTLA
jgi:hypothetical protein